VVSLTALLLTGGWVEHGRDTLDIPYWYRLAPRLVIYFTTLPLYFLTPLITARYRVASNYEVKRCCERNDDTKGTTRALREEEDSFNRELKLANWLNALDTIVRDSQWMQLIQLGVEGVPLMITQLVMMVTGALSGGSPAEESHLEPIRVLCYISMCIVFLHLAFRGYMVCRSYDLQVFAIRWLFVLFDMTSMLYLLVFIATVGKPFASFEALFHRDFSGGCTLSQVWMVGYLTVLCCIAVLLIIVLALTLCNACAPDTLAMVGLALVLAIPCALTLFAVKVSLLNLVLMEAEPYVTSKEGCRGVALLFGFLRRSQERAERTARVQHLCHFLHEALRAKKPKGHARASSGTLGTTLWAGVESTPKQFPFWG
jgi:hypothetical protein